MKSILQAFVDLVAGNATEWVIALNIAICVLACINWLVSRFVYTQHPSVFEDLLTEGKLYLTLTVQCLTILTKNHPFLAFGNVILLMLLAFAEVLLLYHAAKKAYGKAGTWLAHLVTLCVFISFVHFLPILSNTV